MDDFTHLARLDPRFEAVLNRLGPPPLRRRPADFSGLVQIILGQRVSTKAAAAVFAKIEAAGLLDPEGMAATEVDAIAALGLGNAKARTVHGLAHAVIAGSLDFTALATLSDEAVAEILLAHRGIGPWTVEVFLLGCLGRPDVFPAGDLTLRVSWNQIAGTDLTQGQFRAVSEGWRPYRSAAAHLLWAAYNAQDRET